MYLSDRLRPTEGYSTKFVIIQAKHFCPLDFSLRILNLKHKTTILPVVLNGSEAWFITLREERKLMVFENRFLGQIFGPKKDVNGEWRRLHNEELHSLYYSPNIVREKKIEIGRSCSQIGRPYSKIGRR